MIKLSCEYLSVRCIWLCVLFLSRTRFRLSPHFIVASMSNNSLIKTTGKYELKVNTTGLEQSTTLFVKEHSSIQPNYPNDLAALLVLFCRVLLTVCSYHVTYPFWSESTLYNWLKVKEHFAQKRCKTQLSPQPSNLYTSTHPFFQINQIIQLRLIVCTVRLTVYFCHVFYEFIHAL